MALTMQERLKDLRVERGLTLKQLADLHFLQTAEETAREDSAP